MSKILKWIIGIILVIIIGVIIYFTVTKEEKYFDKIKLPETTMVLNKTSKNYLDTIVLVGLQELGLDPIIVVIKELNDKNQPKGDLEEMELMAYLYGKNHQYILNIRKMNRDKSLLIISHELIHLKQREEGRYIDNDGILIFEDEVFTIDNIPDYMDRPWETEAYSNQKSLQKKIEKVLYKSRK